MKEKNTKEFSEKKWAELLSKDRNPSQEKVIITGTFSRTLKINKNDSDKYFPSSKGFTIKQGKEIEIEAQLTGDWKAKIPEWVWNDINASPGERYCIIEREGQYFLKKLELTKQKTSVPGLTLIDSFKWDRVSRRYADFLDVQQITAKHLKLCSAVVCTKYQG